MGDLVDLAALKTIHTEQTRERRQDLIRRTLREIDVDNDRGNIRSMLTVIVGDDGRSVTYVSYDFSDATTLIGAIEVSKMDVLADVQAHRVFDPSGEDDAG
jgi:hypothetical protein